MSIFCTEILRDILHRMRYAKFFLYAIPHIILKYSPKD